MYFDDIEKNKV